jgi:nicotinamidase-related amidase
MLNDFLSRWEGERVDVLVSRTNELIASFRRHDLPIIWVRQEFKADLSDAFLEMKAAGISITIEGTSGAEFFAGLDRQPTDQVIVKKRYSAFFGTPLPGVLVKIQPLELVICGVNTHACVRMTAIDAYQRDYHVVLASDCTGSYDVEHAEISLCYMRNKIARVPSNSDIIAELN